MYFSLWIFAILLAVAFVFPVLEKMLPDAYVEELARRDVDPRALFYTESEQAVDAFHLLKD